MSEQEDRAPASRLRWLLALAGQFVLVVAVVALSGPGRLDINDGQTRYEVARSFVDHGDVVVRNPEVTFCVLPGRGGRLFSSYRLPQSVAGVFAIWLADATGPRGEMRRHFFFTLTSAVACGMLATFYAIWFRRLGHRPAAAIGWALAGVFCTPSWFYGTSVFDDILGTAAVVMALTLAWYGQESKPRLFAWLAGLAVGLAFNCKQPLGLFVLPVLALTVQAGEAWRPRLTRMAFVLVGLGMGLVVYEGYEWYKFPPGSTADHARLLADYLPIYTSNPLPGALCQLLSPSAGVFWYYPPLLLSLIGLPLWLRRHCLFTWALCLACVGFFVFTAFLVFFKGDPGWGPRYLTPVFAALWVFVPSAAALSRRRAIWLLSLGVLVQLLALSVDYHRLYAELRFSSSFYYGQPWIYFYPQAAHLVNRPREIVEIALDDGRDAEVFSPSTLPTEAPPFLHRMDRGPAAVRKYHFLNSFRPWWASQRSLPAEQRPIALGASVLLLVSFAASGVALLAVGLLSRSPRKDSVCSGRGVAVAEPQPALK